MKCKKRIKAFKSSQNDFNKLSVYGFIYNLLNNLKYPWLKLYLKIIIFNLLLNEDDEFFKMQDKFVIFLSIGFKFNCLELVCFVLKLISAT